MRRTATKRGRSRGHSFAGDTAIVILRSTGQVLSGVTILEKAFRIETPDLGVLTVPTKKIKTIVYKNLPSYPTDMLRTLNSSEFNGVILNDPVRMKSDDLGGAVPVPRASVLSIIW
ncbi:MAG: hypothetical protein JJE40_00750 [Vicinamibacteria bacterium]|nr:hypothetical protein [Vicinamibacteria bacterium]